MAKKKKRKQNTLQKTDDLSVPTGLTEEALTRVITNALIEYDKRKEQGKQEKIKKEQEAFDKSLGIKAGKHKFFATLKLLFRPKKYAKGIQANSELTKSVLKGFYKLIEWTLLLLSIFLIACIPLQFIIPNAPIADWYIDVIIAIWAIPIFLLSRIFRIASYEIERIKDYNYLFGLFATVTSIISVVIAIIAIVK
ncbi:MAG: hypothetical protein K2N52_04765 [Clostridia bacterium]|nr:hypothetical protein [Clostridia bacterium]